MPLIANLGFNQLVAADDSLSDHALISLAMYGRAESPYFAAIWAPVELFEGDQVPVRKRTFELDWSAQSIGAHREKKRYPMLVGITAWEGEQPRSVLVYEQFSKSAAAPEIVETENPAIFAQQHQHGVITGLDMCIQLSAKNPFERDTPKENYVAVIHAAPKLATMFNVQRLESVKDKLDGLDSFAQHRAALRGWSRGHHAIPFTKNVRGGRRQVAVHYQDDTFRKWPDKIADEFRCGTPIEGPIKHSQLASRVEKGQAKGYWPLRVGANGLGEHTRIFITWAPKGKLLPLKRYDVVVDGVEATERRVMQGRGFTVAGSFSQASAIATGPATVASGPAPQPAGGGGGGLLFGAAYHLAEIDKLVFSTMHAQGAHAAQIAVAKDSKLKLVRSYTFAERNWPVTNAHHRMRWGSVAKLLMGMRASVESQDFLEAPIADFLPVPLIGPSDGEALGHVADYASTRLLDLLRYQSGWRDDNGYNYFQRVLETVQRLPLQPSDFGTFVKHSKLAFVDEPPATEEIYNNANFIAASEILASRLANDPRNYVPLMLEYWRNAATGESLQGLIGPLPPTRDLCLFQGEPPIRGVPGGTRGTIAKTPLPTPNASAPWVPRTYQLCADAEFAVGAGYFTASAVMLARILQGMCPDPIAPVKQLLTREQRIRMLQTNTVSVEADSPDEGDYGIGASSRVVTFADNPDTTKILKGGDVRYAAGRAETAHYVWGPTSAEHHLTIATVITAAEPIDIEARVESLEKLEYWDSDVNLFPEFFGA